MALLKVEKIIGIETFLTSSNGIGGKLRTTPEDFVVEEISTKLPIKEDGKFVIAKVTAINWETNRLVNTLSKKLQISRKRINFAGTKDKRGKTTRLMSFYNIPKENLSYIKIKDVLIEDIFSSDRPIKLGALVGNRFEINIRNVSNKIKLKQIDDDVSILKKNSGFPNFYGVQRFGTIRPITHIVGKYIVHDDFEKAVMTYIANPIKGENEESYKLRKELQKTCNFAEALKTYPLQLNYEKAILNKLVINPVDFVGAIKELPRNLLTMFVYAYQSYLFNKILSQRIKKGIPLNQAVVGDIILPIRKGIIDDEGILVRKNNLDKVNFQISKGKAFVSGILFGSDSEFSEGEMGVIEHKIIDAEKIDNRDFIIPEIPYISSAGSRRMIVAPFKNFYYKLSNDEMNRDRQVLTLKFELLKGCYATSLLREFMKSEDVRNY